jgi:hypothetical protein
LKAAAFAGFLQASMHDLTQLAWQDGEQVQRPQHWMEHCLWLAEDAHGSCARPVCGNANASAPAHAAANRTHRHDIASLHQAGSRARTLASGAPARHPRAPRFAWQVLRKSR